MNQRLTAGRDDRRAVSQRRGVWLGLAWAAVVNLSCTAILGVDEATCDPEFDDACGERGTVTEPSASNPDEQTTPGVNEPDAAPIGPSLAEACTEYCDLVIDACEEIQQFKTAAGCQTVCEAMYHLGSGNAAGENSVQCHTQYANNALNFSDGLEANCVSAGPMGLSCGGACNNYCEQVERYCPEEFEKMADCADACRDVPRSDVPYTDGFPAGNTLECRVYHIQLAVLQQPDRLVHCGHAVGRSVCADD